MPAAPWFILKTDPESNGFLSGIGSNSLAPTPRFMRNGTEPRVIHILEETADGLISEIDYSTLASLAVGVGVKDKPATGGTFALTVNSTTDDLTALSYAITAADLQTALNANSGVTAAGGVTVTKTSATDVSPLYVITLNTANTALTITATDTALTPPSTVSISNPTVAAVGVYARYTLRILQKPYAYSATWTERNDASDGVTITQVAAGSSTTKARYAVAISPNPISGAFRLLWGQKQVTKVSVQPNTAVAQVWTLTPVAAASITTGSYFDLPDNADTTERFWMDKDDAGASAPATPSGGSVTEITTIATGDTLLQVAGKLADAINAHGDFSVTVSAAGVLTITAAQSEAKTASKTSAGTSGFTVSIATTGSDGQLAGQGFVMDDVTGTVGVYVTVGGIPTAVPAFAAACTRQIAVAIAGGATASTAATNLATAIGTTDGVNAATSSSGLLTITDGSNGTRAGTTTVSSSSYFSTTISQEGASIVATVNATSDAPTFEAQLGNFWTVTKTTDYGWTLTCAALGTPSAPTVENDSLVFLIGLEGSLAFDTLALYEAFAASTSQDITDAVLEVKATYTGLDPQVVLQYPALLTRDLLDGTITNIPELTAASLRFNFTITSYTGGTSIDLDSIVTTTLTLPYALAFFETTDGFSVYQLQAGTDAEASPGVIRPDDYHATTNARVWIRRN